MILTLKKKKKVIEDLAIQIEQNKFIFVANYNRLTAEEAVILRRKSFNLKYISVKVIPKKLCQKIFLNSKHSCLTKILKGSIIIFFSNKDQKIISSLLYNFNKKYNKLDTLGISLDTKFIPKTDLKILATLPNLKQLILSLILIIKYLINKFVSVLKFSTNQLIITFHYLKDK